MAKRKRTKKGKPPALPREVLLERAESAIERGSSRGALDLAKEYEKRFPGPEAEDLLLRAYRARIDGLTEKGGVEDALRLVEFVRERFGERAPDLGGLAARIAVRAGRLNDVLRSLAAPDLDPERAGELEDLLFEGLRDPAEIVEAGILPKGHPLREEAEIAASVLDRVTSGPVSPDDPALIAALPRRSRFMPFVLLARAIAAAHAGHSERAEELLRAIPAGSRAAAVAPAVRSVARGRPEPDLSPRQRLLVEQALSGERQVVADLDALQAAFDDCRHEEALRIGQRLSRRFATVAPGLRPELLRLLAGECLVHDLHPEDFLTLLSAADPVGESQRLAALALEADEYRLDAIDGWEAYLSVRGGRAKPDERALVFLRQASLAVDIRMESLHEVVEECLAGESAAAPGFTSGEDAAEWLKGRFRESAGGPDPAKYFQRALEARPSRRTWKEYVGYLKVADPRQAAKAARRWHEQAPDDLEAVLILGQLAERNGDVEEALGWMGRAEKISPADPRVRGRSGRLLVREAVDALAENRDEDAREWLGRIGEQRFPPEMGAVRPALEWFAADTEEGRTDALAALVKSEGEPEAMLLLNLMNDALRTARFAFRVPSLPELSGPRLLAALARDYRVLTAANLDLDGSANLAPALRESLAGATGPEPDDLVALGDLLDDWDEPSGLYHLSRHGLEQGGPSRCRFLLYRGIALRGFPGPPARWIGCWMAARDMARRAGDEETARRAVEELEDEGDQPPLTEEEIRAILDRERERREPPRRRSRRPRQRRLFE